jgi:hypothetical protein
MDILNLQVSASSDDDIESYQYQQYASNNPQNINVAGPITIDVNGESTFCHPSKAYILIEGTIESTTNVPYTDVSYAAFANNGPMHMFKSIRYKMNDQNIESIYFPGQCITMLNALRKGDEFDKVEGINQCYAKDEISKVGDGNGFSNRAKMLKAAGDDGTLGRFSYCLPLSDIFGFCADYEKVIYGMKHTLEFDRATDDDALIRNKDATPAGKITLDKLVLYMPVVRPAIAPRAALMQTIASKTTLKVPFREITCNSNSVIAASKQYSWRLNVSSNTVKPRFIIIGFQTDKNHNQRRNPSIFDHLNLESLTVSVNEDRYPTQPARLDFKNMSVSRAYKDFAEFKAKFYGSDPEVTTACGITPYEFVITYPIHVVDLRYQLNELKTSVQDIRIDCEFREAIPAATTVYAVMVSSKEIELQSDGNGFRVMT